MFKQQKQAAWSVEKKKNNLVLCVLTHLNIMSLTFRALLLCVCVFGWVFSNNEVMPCILFLSSFT